MPGFTHISSKSTPQMVSIADKLITRREAVAVAYIRLPKEVQEQLTMTKAEYFGPKGAILQTANLAGIMGAKKTAELIPLCHNIPLDKVKLEFHSISFGFKIKATATAQGKTGVEMEALCAVSIAALTIYDMCKALSSAIQIENIHLVSKTGGKQDYYSREQANEHKEDE